MNSWRALLISRTSSNTPILVSSLLRNQCICHDERFTPYSMKIFSNRILWLVKLGPGQIIAYVPRLSDSKEQPREIWSWRFRTRPSHDGRPLRLTCCKPPRSMSTPSQKKHCSRFPTEFIVRLSQCAKEVYLGSTFSSQGGLRGKRNTTVGNLGDLLLCRSAAPVFRR